MSKKQVEKEIGQVFVENFNLKKQTDLKLDENYMNHRLDNDFPDLKFNLKDVSFQGEVIEVHLWPRGEMIKLQEVQLKLEKKLRKDGIERILVTINGFNLPKKKDIKGFVEKVSEIAGNFVKTRQKQKGIKLANNNLKQEPLILSKYAKTIALKSDFMVTKVLLYPDPKSIDRCALIMSAIKNKENRYSKDEKIKTILILNNETLLLDEVDVGVFKRERSLSSLTFKGIWWVDLSTKKALEIT